jgi:glutamine synthetase
VAYRAEYIWIDGTEPVPMMRSKTKVIEDGKEPGIWGFDGSSTNQAPGSNSDCVLQPVYSVPDTLRNPDGAGDDVLVLCEVLLPESFAPHPTNTRAECVEVAEKFAAHEPLFGIEQEYTFFKEGRPLGWPTEGYYYPAPQGPYYCGVGAVEIAGRDIVEAHTTACIDAGIAISGTNAEVMLGQWEFQVGPVGTVEVADQLWMARYLMYRVAENFGVNASISAKPIKGDWNGAGAHTNFSTNAMREGYDPIIAACEAMGAPGKVEEHLAGYGDGYEDRLTGLHETAHYSEFRYGVSDRGASIRIPWQVAQDGKGYIEDRRPNANIDPYVVSRLLTNTICSAIEPL